MESHNPSEFITDISQIDQFVTQAPQHELLPLQNIVKNDDTMSDVFTPVVNSNATLTTQVLGKRKFSIRTKLLISHCYAL